MFEITYCHAPKAENAVEEAVATIGLINCGSAIQRLGIALSL